MFSVAEYMKYWCDFCMLWYNITHSSYGLDRAYVTE